jgi:putative membrane protein
MPSEQRLHPVSLLFSFARSLKAFALPGLLAALSFGRASSPWRPTFGPFQPPDTWQLWLMLLLIPSGVAALARYLSFRLRYDETELVIRSGILFRNERHVPYHRIQNLDAVQNVFHRLLGVTEVRIDTGASKEPEATISVLPEAAFADMRRRVFAGRVQPQTTEQAALPAVEGSEGGRTVLQLPLRELMLLGFLENRGMVVIGAFYGLLWEAGVLGPFWDRFFKDGSYTPGMVRAMMRTISEGNIPGLSQIAVVMTGIAAFLFLVRLVSMAWSVTKLYGFRLTRVGDDLRTQFGLLTRVSATLPVRRVQSVTVREPPLYRLCSRAAVRVETAGGGGAQPGAGGQPTRQREMIAPIIRTSDLPAMIREVLPDADLAAIDWRPAHPRAFRRAVKPALAFAALITLMPAVMFDWRAVFAGLLVVPWMIYATRRQLQYLGWAATGDLVAFRSGWLWRSVTLVPVGRIQAVDRIETPFDRRHAMARVRVDTAGASERSHRVDIPYLDGDVATALHQRLATAVGASAFRW